MSSNKTTNIDNEIEITTKTQEQLKQDIIEANNLNNNDLNIADIIITYLTKPNNMLNAVERAFAGVIIYSRLSGVDFKCGLMNIKPKCKNYKLSFDYNGNKVEIDYNKYRNDGLTIDDLRFNNLDYICLKAYNKDVYISLWHFKGVYGFIFI